MATGKRLSLPGVRRLDSPGKRPQTRLLDSAPYQHQSTLLHVRRRRTTLIINLLLQFIYKSANPITPNEIGLKFEKSFGTAIGPGGAQAGISRMIGRRRPGRTARQPIETVRPIERESRQLSPLFGDGDLFSVWGMAALKPNLVCPGAKHLA